MKVEATAEVLTSKTINLISIFSLYCKLMIFGCAGRPALPCRTYTTPPPPPSQMKKTCIEQNLFITMTIILFSFSGVTRGWYGICGVFHKGIP